MMQGIAQVEKHIAEGGLDASMVTREANVFDIDPSLGQVVELSQLWPARKRKVSRPRSRPCRPQVGASPAACAVQREARRKEANDAAAAAAAGAATEEAEDLDDELDAGKGVLGVAERWQRLLAMAGSHSAWPALGRGGAGNGGRSRARGQPT